VEEIQNDPQALVNGYMVDYEDPDLGKVKIPGYPIHFSSQTAGTRSLAPTLGQHTREVLKELGHSDPDIDRLIQEGVAR
jgi:crotonobetainyl-CoA:carnitine CoA-transferase CaiB-like acyl-CoA transferase